MADRLFSANSDVHVVPPSALTKTVDPPTAMQCVVSKQVTAVSGGVPVGTGSSVNVVPPSEDNSTSPWLSDDPPAPTATHSDVLGQLTPEKKPPTEGVVELPTGLGVPETDAEAGPLPAALVANTVQE
jgi:hypothetical protein